MNANISLAKKKKKKKKKERKKERKQLTYSIKSFIDVKTMCNSLWFQHVQEKKRKKIKFDFFYLLLNKRGNIIVNIINIFERRRVPNR